MKGQIVWPLLVVFSVLTLSVLSGDVAAPTITAEDGLTTGVERPEIVDNIEPKRDQVEENYDPTDDTAGEVEDEASDAELDMSEAHRRSLMYKSGSNWEEPTYSNVWQPVGHQPPENPSPGQREGPSGGNGQSVGVDNTNPGEREPGGVYSLAGHWEDEEPFYEDIRPQDDGPVNEPKKSVGVDNTNPNYSRAGNEEAFYEDIRPQDHGPVNEPKKSVEVDNDLYESVGRGEDEKKKKRNKFKEWWSKLTKKDQRGPTGQSEVGRRDGTGTGMGMGHVNRAHAESMGQRFGDGTPDTSVHSFAGARDEKYKWPHPYPQDRNAEVNWNAAVPERLQNDERSGSGGAVNNEPIYAAVYKTHQNPHDWKMQSATASDGAPVGSAFGSAHGDQISGAVVNELAAELAKRGRY